MGFLHHPGYVLQCVLELEYLSDELGAMACGLSEESFIHGA